MIDESEVLTPADEEYHINKKEFTIPFVCGARNLGEALRRIDEGAAMIRTKGEPGTGNIVEAVRHMRMVMGEIRTIQGLDEEEIWKYARKIEAPIDLVKETAELGNYLLLTCCWWNSYSRRCFFNDAIRFRWYFCWFRYFQIQ